MVNWVPIQHQLDILRMDMQYTLRQIVEKTERGKAYRWPGRDQLIEELWVTGLIRPAVDGEFQEVVARPWNIWIATFFGKQLLDNDHAIREIAMDWMNALPVEDLDILQNDISQWPFRDPAVRKFMENMRGTSGGPIHDDFFPQAPWYWHTVGKKKVPRNMRAMEAEQLYVQGGYTGKEFSAAEVIENGAVT